MYGINVNQRHLSLIADYMTRSGSYVALNRIGMADSMSIFNQMSFETTTQFMLKAAQDGFSDTIKSPSSRIVMGSVSKLGTGCFDLLVPLHSS
jgi:DNA-directed RNA polymerase I subunit RPA1